MARKRKTTKRKSQKKELSNGEDAPILQGYEYKKPSMSYSKEERINWIRTKTDDELIEEYKKLDRDGHIEYTFGGYIARMEAIELYFGKEKLDLILLKERVSAVEKRASSWVLTIAFFLAGIGVYIFYSVISSTN